MSYPHSKVVIGCLHGKRPFFPRTMEQAFGNGPAITYRRMRRRDRTHWGGAWAPNSHSIPWREAAPFLIVGAAAFAAFIFVGAPLF